MTAGGRESRLVAEITVNAAGVVRAIEGVPGCVVVDVDGAVFGPATDWLLQVSANDSSVNTVRAYAMSLLRFLRFLWAVGYRWDQASEVEVRDFVLWARQAKKLVGSKRPTTRQGRMNLTTGKRYQGPQYSPATINHTLTVVSEFYRFNLDRGRGPVVNPVPDPRGGRPYAHHDPDSAFTPHRRAQLRQKEVKRVPRAIPDAQFDDLFRRLNNNRDRALVAFYVSSGARASELLGVTGDRVNYGDQMIGVIRKGGDLQWIPAAPHAFVWLRLYQLERGVARHDQPIWLTRREPFEALSYDAFRAVLNRANSLLGTNWTTHDLRHTFSIRALDGGMPLHELQTLLGHVSLDSTTIYTTPRPDDVVEHHRAIFGPPPGPTPDPGTSIYDADDMAVLFNRGSS